MAFSPFWIVRMVSDLLVTDAFVGKKADAAAEETLPLTKSPDIGGSQSVRPLHNRRKVLGIAVLLSVIVVGVTSAFWLSSGSVVIPSKSQCRLRGTCNRCGMPQDLASDPLGPRLTLLNT